MRTLCHQVNPVSLLVQLLILTAPIFQQMPTATAVAVKSGETLSNHASKHQKLPLGNSSRGTVTTQQGNVADEASVETAPDEDEVDEAATKIDRTDKTTRPAKQTIDSKKPTRTGRKRPNPAVESAKSAIIREFVASHGDRIRKSRKHADLFDGSGYLIDMMKELHQYESRAEEETGRSRHRHKRSTSAADGNDNVDQDLPNFASLSEALAHLNGGHQKETISADFNVRFVNDNDANEELQDEGEDEQLASESKQRLRRRKRSLGNPDDEEDGDDPDGWLRHDDDKVRDNAEADAAEESRRHREAAESMERLDADLKELAKYLDEQAAEEQLLQEEEQQPNPLGKFNHGMADAYKNLVKLRGMAQDVLQSPGTPAEPGQPSAQQQPRMRDLYPDKTANWRVDAEVLDATLRDLKKYYRRTDEL